MKFVLFYHSLISDWNHGNAHFLRGVTSELLRAGHEVEVYEPRNGWSLANLEMDAGSKPLYQFSKAYPQLKTRFIDSTTAIEQIVEDANVVMVHEWNEPSLISRIGRHRRDHGGYHLLFHDTHHRCVTAPESIEQCKLQNYDGVLAFGNVIRDIYLENSWCSNAWTWHEAADTSIFYPIAVDPEIDANDKSKTDLVWIGNWGDDERSQEIRQYLIKPVRELGIRADVYGVRYPQSAITALTQAGIDYRGWLPNFLVPRVFAKSRCTIHIPRRPYREVLSGIPTIRIFEALACGVPLICQRWKDSENLFREGKDYLVVDTPKQMTDAVKLVLSDPELRASLSAHGLQSILKKHTCAHRVTELIGILNQLSGQQTKKSGQLIRRERITPS